MANQKAKSFGQRHLELGKMIKCQVCGLRHRSSIVCKQIFTTVVDRGPNEFTVPERIAPETRKGILGAAMFAKRRFRPHHSHRLLRIVQLTQDLFPKYYPAQIQDPEKAMKAARGEAVHKLYRELRAERKQRLAMQHRSRQINRGLTT